MPYFKVLNQVRGFHGYFHGQADMLEQVGLLHSPVLELIW